MKASWSATASLVAGTALLGTALVALSAAALPNAGVDWADTCGYAAKRRSSLRS